MNVDQYLARFNSSNLKENSVQNLYRLQQNHLLNIPFENLDIFNGNELSFDLEKLFDKIVRKKRGGVFFELNILFAWLLRELGYKCEFVFCQDLSMKQNDNSYFNHIALILIMNDSKFLVDVGLQHNYRSPIKFIENIVQYDITGFYKILNDKENFNTFVLHKNTSAANYQFFIQNEIDLLNEWTPLYKFSNLPLSSKCELKNIFAQNKSNLFSNQTVCVIHTEYSIINLIGHELSEIKFMHSKKKSKYNSTLTNSEVLDALKNIYGIELDHDSIGY